MHVPDGFLDAKTAAGAAVLSVAGLGIALRHLRRTFPPQRVPLIGLAAAFVFAAQMINFPVAGGTSGHLLGATLAAVLLGPAAAVLVMSAVVLLQCLLFADGGLTALGANLFNMALAAPLLGYAVYAFVRRATDGGLRGRLVATAFAAWISTVVASVACAGQLALSGTVAWRLALPAMGLVHMAIGLGEAAITTLVVVSVARARPELLDPAGSPSHRGSWGSFVTLGGLVSLGIVLFVAPFACGWPDGLERVAESLGFAGRATSSLGAPLADYTVQGVTPAAWSTVVAGAAGTTVAFLFAIGLARVLAPTTPVDGRLSAETRS